MKWLPTVRMSAISACGRYELRGAYSGGHFAWRGRVIATDELVESSADRAYVEQQCERHADGIDAEVTP